MKNRLTPLFMVAALILSSTIAFAQSPQHRERIEASFLLALGRTPSAAEVGEWSSQEKLSVKELVARHRQQLQNDATARRATALKAFTDAFGRAPTEAELTAAAGDNRIYTEQMKRYIQSLADNPAEYARVLDRAYQLVVRREVYDLEINYWKPHGTLSYALLVGCIENWGRRNQPGLMVTAGTPTLSVNSDYLATARVSPAVAEEARAVVGLGIANTDYFTYGSNRTVIAAGADDLISNGRIHFVTAGKENLVTAPSGS